MGMIWRSTMPLLSTLAALVIIVHSQEDMERGYRRELRPRVVDTSFEQPWKAIDMEPLVQHSSRAEVWNESPEEAPARRRPVRKRKRRPLPYPDMEPQERYQEGIQSTYHDVDYHESQQTMEATRRRRKRPDINHYLKEELTQVEERPSRRRGLRRKRPMDFQMYELISSEPRDDKDEKGINNYTKYDQFIEYDDAVVTTENTRVYSVAEPNQLENRLKTLINNGEKIDSQLYNQTFGLEEQRKLFGVSNVGVHAAEPEILSAVDENERLKTIEAGEQSKHDHADIMGMIKKSKENGVIDPMFLKHILKRSNGSSLSEVLQRHNLSLTDLLQGKNEAISALNAEVSEEPLLHLNDASLENTPQLYEAESKYPTIQQSTPEQKGVGIESNFDEEIAETTTEFVEAVKETTEAVETERPETRPRMNAKRRFPTGIRRKLRMRPMLNSTLKAQLSRDLIALSARKYKSNRNATKSREWKDIVPLMVDRSKTNDETSKHEATQPTPTTTETPADTTVDVGLDISNSSDSVSYTAETGSVKENEIENTVLTTNEPTTEPTTTIIIEVSPSELTERPEVTPIVRPAGNNNVLRRQVFNNRLNRKRQKHKKSSTTENPNDDLMKNFLGMADLVSASQFIERTQKPYTTIKEENTESDTELEDFLTTQQPRTDGESVKGTQVVNTRFASSTTRNAPQTNSTSTTEHSAKIEIEDLFNDTMTSERFAKILRERNMTLSELVKHRERGSSHVHLADIFHNASKEPNPPEPFLTKSSIEPISKKTYPLRAILEASKHETTTRPTSPYVSQADQRNDIPVVMDFGNNVNENGESMGIVSLFNKITDKDLPVAKTEVRQDSEGTPYVSSVISVNATTVNDTNRESRVLINDEDWNVLISFMKEHNISTFEEDLQALNKGDTEKESLREDLDIDGVMVLEDMQHLQNLESNSAAGLEDDLGDNIYERRENLSDTTGTLNEMPSHTKSVAIATASILGLAAILFLLTYVAFKWKQQRDKLRNKLRKKESLNAGQIPSPVFENRKGHKYNCSSRSISPMIGSTNIYMSTIDSRTNESPEYAWDSLRKPFQ